MDLNAITDVLPAGREAQAGWRDGDAWLAGGTWLFSEPQPRLRRLHDLTAFDWPSLATTDAGVEIAATCTLAELSRWRPPTAWPAAGLVAQCCDALLGSFKVWNTATVGGNICLALPAGPMTSLTASLDGVCTIWTADGTELRMPVVDFVVGPGRNALPRGALLRSVFVPAAALRTVTAFRQLSLNAAGRSASVVIGRRSLEDGSLAITVTAAVARPVQLRFDSPPNADELASALDRAELPYHDDVHGNPEWREHLTRMYAAEVCAELSW